MKKSLGKWMTVMPLSYDAIIANVPWISANKDLLELIKVIVSSDMKIANNLLIK